MLCRYPLKDPGISVELPKSMFAELIEHGMQNSELWCPIVEGLNSSIVRLKFIRRSCRSFEIGYHLD